LIKTDSTEDLKNMIKIKEPNIDRIQEIEDPSFDIPQTRRIQEIEDPSFDIPQTRERSNTEPRRLNQEILQRVTLNMDTFKPGATHPKFGKLPPFNPDEGVRVRPPLLPTKSEPLISITKKNEILPISLDEDIDDIISSLEKETLLALGSVSTPRQSFIEKKEEVVVTPPSPTAKSSIQFNEEVYQLRNQLEELQDMKKRAVDMEDFTKAHKIKEQIVDIQSKIKKLSEGTDQLEKRQVIEKQIHRMHEELNQVQNLKGKAVQAEDFIKAHEYKKQEEQLLERINKENQVLTSLPLPIVH